MPSSACPWCDGFRVCFRCCRVWRRSVEYATCNVDAGRSVFGTFDCGEYFVSSRYANLNNDDRGGIFDDRAETNGRSWRVGRCRRD